MFKDLNDLADKLEGLKLPTDQEDELDDILFHVGEATLTLQNCYRRLLKLNAEVSDD